MQAVSTMTRLSDDELTALLEKHVEVPNDRVTKWWPCKSYCTHESHRGFQPWPCETVRLATEVRDLRLVKDAAQGVRDSPVMLGGMRWGRTEYAKRMAALDTMLARYEEGGR